MVTGNQSKKKYVGTGICVHIVQKHSFKPKISLFKYYRHAIGIH